MKKIFYVILFAITCGVSVTACTEEEITPVAEEKSGMGGGASDPRK